MVDIGAGDKVCRMDLTSDNPELTFALLANPAAFDDWVTNKLQSLGCRYGAGGYLENRIIYAGREHFDTQEEPRSIHLGIDIWAAAGTSVYAPLSGTIHSFRDNANYGDYGPAIILQHNVAGLILYSLYGHLSRTNLERLKPGQQILAGQQIANFGTINENGNWPPHLHFQLMLDIEGMQGDYPGVCRPSEMERYLKNIPNPDILLQINAET